MVLGGVAFFVSLGAVFVTRQNRWGRVFAIGGILTGLCGAIGSCAAAMAPLGP